MGSINSATGPLFDYRPGGTGPLGDPQAAGGPQSVNQAGMPLPGPVGDTLGFMSGRPSTVQLGDVMGMLPSHAPAGDLDFLGALEAPPQQPKGKSDPAPGMAETVSRETASVVERADTVRTAAQTATNARELRSLPVLGRAQGRTGRALTSLADSRAGQVVRRALENGRVVAPMARGLMRAAPVAGAVTAAFDIKDSVAVMQDRQASTTEKILAGIKGTAAAASGVAGTATLVLAPTGVGAAVAGGIALGAGIIAAGADYALSRMRGK